LDHYRNLFDAVLIDEFQDTDRVQYEIIKQLVSVHRNLFVVADDDQSIFSWRGANPNNIELFRREFARENVILLTENYRSRPEIIEQARQLINMNFAPAEQLKRKSVQAANQPEASLTGIAFDAVKVENFSSDQEEAAFIIKEIARQMERDA